LPALSARHTTSLPDERAAHRIVILSAAKNLIHASASGSPRQKRKDLAEEFFPLKNMQAQNPSEYS
jgi:hypothetical protein